MNNESIYNKLADCIKKRQGQMKKRKSKNSRILEKYNGSKLGWLHDSIFFIIAVIVLFCIFRFCIGIAVVGGDSMSPTLMDGDVVLYSRMISEYKPGDVVSVRVPSGEYYVKRVIATGGDVVDLEDGMVTVNGTPVEEWGYGETMKETGAVIYPYTVRPGNVFVLGDNRTVSLDSRTFGEVNRRQIRGKIILQAGTGSASGFFIRKITNE